jgi:hypothetical protein
VAAKKHFGWDGDAFIRRVTRETAEAVSETVNAAVDDAKTTHPWHEDPEPHTLKSGRKVDTHLDRQIRSARVFITADGHVVGAFGYTSRKGFYGLFHEEGTVHEHAFPTIRPAADRNFPTFPDRLKRRLSRFDRSR